MIGSSDDYATFVRVVRRGSITAAARELGVPRATASRRVARLEEALGVALVHRTTRSITPTTAGQELFEAFDSLLERWEEAEDAVRSRSRAITGRVRLAVLPLVMPALAPVLQHLGEVHPGLVVEVVGRVRLVDLRHEGFDAAIWGGELRDSDLVARSLMAGNVGLVASPDYLDRAGVPDTAEALQSHRLLCGHDMVGEPRRWWPLRDGGRVRVSASFVTDDAILLREATLAGLGIGLLSDLNVQRPLEDGRLRRVLAEEVGRTATVRLITTRRTLLPARTRVVLDAVAAHFDTTAAGAGASTC